MSSSSVLSVVQLLSTILANDPTLQKCAVKLNPKTVKFLNALLANDPKDLEQFQQLFQQITSDGKIDLNDVPAILALLKSLYTMAQKNTEYNITVEDVTNLIQFILVELATVKGVNQKDVKQLLIIVTSASDLLSIAGLDHKSIVNVKVPSCMSRLFGKK
jgi:hypothetical protein